MDYIFETAHNRKHLLYSIEEHIVIRRLQADMISRPLYISHNYRESLSAVLHNDTIYYAYISREGNIEFKNTTSDKTLLQIHQSDNIKLSQSAVTLFNDKLILFYCVNSLDNSSWKIVSHISPTNEDSNTIIDIAESLPYKPHFSILNTGSHLIIDIQDAEQETVKHILELTSDYNIICHDEITDNMEQASLRQLERINNLQNDVEGLRQASNIMMNKISSLLTENERLRNECTNLQQSDSSYTRKISEQETQIKNLSSSLDETKKALTIREAQIESAKQQYNELMDVAEKYRDEAIKWRSKLMSR